MRKLMENRREFLLEEIARCDKIVKSAPKGKLIVTSNGKYSKWYVTVNGKCQYLPKRKREQAIKLAKKRYAMERKADLIRELEAIDYYIRYCVPKLYEDIAVSQLNELLTDVSFIKDRRIQEWLSVPYRKLDGFQGDLKHRWKVNERVRSKAEMDIATELSLRNIPFKYECPVEINGKIRFPDFTIYKSRTNEVKYWEHLGLMDDTRYITKNLAKIKEYSEGGIFVGDQLILSFETSNEPLDVVAIKRIVDDIELWINS